MRVKDVLKKVPFIYNSIVRYIGYRNRKKRESAYRKYGVEALRAFVDCMDTNDFKYTLAFGSILGAIREHGFIKHDLDIDVFMWHEDFSIDIVTKLKECGFSLVRSISIDGDKYGREDTFQYKGVSIDIFYLYPAIDQYPYCCDFVPGKNKFERMPRRIEIPVSKKRKLVTFEDLEVFVPENAEQICEFRYGPSYMTPDPNWHWESAYNATRLWPEMKKKVVIEFNS